MEPSLRFEAGVQVLTVAALFFAHYSIARDESGKKTLGENL